MEKRAIIAVVLSLVVLIGYQYLFVKPPEKKPAVPVEQPPASLGEKPSLPGQPAAGSKPSTIDIPSKIEGPERSISVDTPLYSARVLSKGAVVSKWTLKNYKEADGSPVELLRGEPDILPLETGSNTEFSKRNMDCTISGGDLLISEREPKGTAVFTCSVGNLRFRRTMTFHADTYRVDITDETESSGSYWVTLGENFGITGEKTLRAHEGPVVLDGVDREEYKAAKLKDQAKSLFPKDLKWIADEESYFFAALVPGFQAEEVKIWEKRGIGLIALKMNPGTNKYVLYAGPKSIDTLKKENLDLEHIVDFGFFSVIARPIFWLLKYINGFIGNYGWSIIILTILLRVPFIPLLNKSQRSMKKLQQLQPKMAELKEKYKKDQQRMQKEMMELYRKYKVNPMGGCLPMLLQIPFFFALYKVLLVAVELRGAPFMLWIHDLSAKDPYYVLPIVMGLTMLLQQKMTPTSADPKQAKIMMFMPIVFTFMFLNFSSGLVLYWLMSNVLSIVQQFFVNMKAKKEQASA